MSFISQSPQDTHDHGRQCAKECQTGTVIRLQGTLGAGKTTWVQGFIRAIGVVEEITSPTFSLVHEYTSGRLNVYHWDLYRLNSETDWSVLDLADHLPSTGITLVEWPDRYTGLWPKNCIKDITIETLEGCQRRITTEVLNS